MFLCHNWSGLIAREKKMEKDGNHSKTNIGVYAPCRNMNFETAPTSKTACLGPTRRPWPPPTTSYTRPSTSATTCIFAYRNPKTRRPPSSSRSPSWSDSLRIWRWPRPPRNRTAKSFATMCWTRPLVWKRSKLPPTASRPMDSCAQKSRLGCLRETPTNPSSSFNVSK